MTRKLSILAAVLSIFFLTSVAMADKPFFKRIDNQQRAINQGVLKGELTRGEADTLQSNLDFIKDKYSRMSADGTLNNREAARLDQMLRDNSNMIYKKKHNAPRRLY